MPRKWQAGANGRQPPSPRRSPQQPCAAGGWPLAGSAASMPCQGRSRGVLGHQRGWPTSVTYGLLQGVAGHVKGLHPPGLVIAFDTAEPTFRTRPTASYKATAMWPGATSSSDSGNLPEIPPGAMGSGPCAWAPGFEADEHDARHPGNRAGERGWAELRSSRVDSRPGSARR